MSGSREPDGRAGRYNLFEGSHSAAGATLRPPDLEIGFSDHVGQQTDRVAQGISSRCQRFRSGVADMIRPHIGRRVAHSRHVRPTDREAAKLANRTQMVLGRMQHHPEIDLDHVKINDPALDPIRRDLAHYRVQMSRAAFSQMVHPEVSDGGIQFGEVQQVVNAEPVADDEGIKFL